MKNCGYCGRENDEAVFYCRECATPFQSDSVTPRLDPTVASAEKQMISGALWCVGGLFVTIYTFVSAVNSPVGGVYIVTWGAIVFGARQYFRGWHAKYLFQKRNQQSVATGK